SSWQVLPSQRGHGGNSRRTTLRPGKQLLTTGRQMTDQPRAAKGNDAGPTATRAPSSTGVPGAAGPAPAGPYDLLHAIAHGGMGVVSRATDTTRGREVAVKVLSDRFEPGSGAARRFVGEARIAGQLQHPGIPAVHDLGALPDGRPFLAMKLVKG